MDKLQIYSTTGKKIMGNPGHFILPGAQVFARIHNSIYFNGKFKVICMSIGEFRSQILVVQRHG